MAESHEVSVMCLCDDIEQCDMERYIADIRIAYREMALLKEALDNQWHTHSSLSA